jgi:hypothetical protein
MIPKILLALKNDIFKICQNRTKISIYEKRLLDIFIDNNIA